MSLPRVHIPMSKNRRTGCVILRCNLHNAGSRNLSFNFFDISVHRDRRRRPLILYMLGCSCVVSGAAAEGADNADAALEGGREQGGKGENCDEKILTGLFSSQLPTNSLRILYARSCMGKRGRWGWPDRK